MVSTEKVETVVKAPQNPAPRKARSSGENEVRLRDRATRNPKRKDPPKLTIKVP